MARHVSLLNYVKISRLCFSQPHAQKVRNLRHCSQVVLALNADDEGEDVVIIEGEALLLPPGNVAATLPPFATKYAQLMARIGTTPQTMAAGYTQAIQVQPRRFRPE